MSWKRGVILLVLCFGLLAPLPAHAQATTVYDVAFPHIAFGHGAGTDYWESQFLIWNTGATQATVKLNYYNTLGSPLVVSIVGSSPASSHTFTIAPLGLLDAHVDGQNCGICSVTNEGWAAVTVVTGTIKGEVVFTEHRTSVVSDATVPMINNSGPLCVIPLPGPAAPSINIPFDNEGHNSGFAVANTTNVAVTYDVKYVDQNGTTICDTSVNIPAFGQTAAIMTLGSGPSLPVVAACPGAANQKGSIIISGGTAAAMGLRYNADYSLFTTLLQ